MTPTEARQITLKEIIDFCESEKEKYRSIEHTVINEQLPNGNYKVEAREYLLPEYHAFNSVKEKCTELMNSISAAA